MGTIHLFWQTPRPHFGIVPSVVLGVSMAIVAEYGSRSRLVRLLGILPAGGIGGALVVLSWSELPSFLSVLFGAASLPAVLFLYRGEERDREGTATAPE